MTTLWPKADELEIATEHQRSQYELATAKPVGLLGGSPGTGKTFTTGQIIKCALKEYGAADVAIAAPTGKAAQRLNETMISHGVDGIQATTIHRLLGVSRNGRDQNGWGFIHNATNPLPQRFFFIDELSMGGCGLLANFFSALRPGSHFMGIGDQHQLPPVEHGAPLRDMIAAGLPYGELTEIHRNEGDVIRACRDIKEGRRFTPSKAIDLDAGANLCHLEAARPTLAVQALSWVLRNIPADLRPAWDVQILCAVNDNSEVARKPLNAMLQELFNPAGERIDGVKFRLGDKVICTSNSMLPLVHCPYCHFEDSGVTGEPCITWDGKFYVCGGCDEPWKPADALQDFVANGEIGKVALLDKSFMHVAFDSPERTIRTLVGAHGDFDLAYAITTHKSQGSSWPVVVVMADDSNGADRVTSKEWWYTALSRMERLVFTVGKLATIHRQCRKSALSERKTFLRELLAGA